MCLTMHGSLEVPESNLLEKPFNFSVDLAFSMPKNPFNCRFQNFLTYNLFKVDLFFGPMLILMCNIRRFKLINILKFINETSRHLCQPTPY